MFESNKVHKFIGRAYFYSSLVCGSIIHFFKRSLATLSFIMQVKNWTLLDKDFSIPGGELGT